MNTAYRNHRPCAQAYSAPEANYGPRFDHYGPMPYQHHLVPAQPIVAPQGVAMSKGVLAIAALVIVAAGAGVGALAINLTGSETAPAQPALVYPDYSANTAVAPPASAPAEPIVVNVPPAAPSGPVIMAPAPAPKPAPAPNRAPAPAPAPKPAPAPNQAPAPAPQLAPAPAPQPVPAPQQIPVPLPIPFPPPNPPAKPADPPAKPADPPAPKLDERGLPEGFNERGLPPGLPVECTFGVPCG
jgi:hypothetical protein